MIEQQQMICAACFQAAAKIEAHFARVLLDHAGYGNECTSTFVPVVEAARHVLGRVRTLLEDKTVLEHTCGGNPNRCEKCGTPRLIEGECSNLFCGAEMGPEDWLKLDGWKSGAWDEISKADCKIREVEVRREHHGGESLWPFSVFVTADGRIYHATPRRPTRLTDDEVMALPSKRRNEVEPTDNRLIGEPRGPDIGESDGDGAMRSVGISWWDAYERPSTRERFRVYDYDRE